MENKNKLDITAISFDDMIGDGLQSVPEDEKPESIDNEVDTEEVDAEEQYEEESKSEISEEYEGDEEGDEEYEDGYAEEDSDGQNIIFEIANTLGFDPEGEYDETIEGLTNFVRDISQEAAEEQLNNLFEQYPEVQKHLDFLMSGGESKEFLEAYNPQVDFAAIEVPEDDTNTQRAILGQYFQAKGHDNEFIADMLDTLESNGKLFNKSELARQELANAQEEYRQELYQRQQEEFQQQLQENEEFWENVADTIEEGNEFAGIRIPDNQKSKFFDYISEPVGPNGETQRDLDYEQSDIDMKLAIDYLMYSGFKLDEIIDTKARTKSAQSLRERIVSNEQRVKSARRVQRQSKSFDPDNLDLNALLS